MIDFGTCTLNLCSEEAKSKFLSPSTHTMSDPGYGCS